MTETLQCPDCGTPLADESPDGLCPKCLLRVALKPDDETELAIGAATIDSTTDTQAASTAVLRDFGDYELLEEIARGGMGVVYKARQKGLDRLVAVKMILTGQLAGEAEIDRFRVEAQAAANLDHPGIVPIYEVGVQDGQHFFSMAYVAGESLSTRLERGPVEPREAAELLRQITLAVQYAHGRGVIHRDLKPANVLLDAAGPRITDFGLAKRVESDTQLTATGQALGTPSFMPPEQAEGKGAEIGPTADVYALGAILYTMLTGSVPFQADSLLDTLMMVREREPDSPRDLNKNVPQDLETICLKCLEKSSGERYQTAGELLEELELFLDGQPINARPLSPLGRLLRWRRIVQRNKDVRIRSATEICGIPLVDIALGHNKETGETYGHARGIFAYGDVATGVFACGGVARGLIAYGKHAFGGIAMGGTAVGIVPLGMFSAGLVGGGFVTIGFATSGLVAIGYGAVGMFAIGKHVMGGFVFSL